LGKSKGDVRLEKVSHRNILPGQSLKEAVSKTRPIAVMSEGNG
jgi:hypothetical protein